MRTKSIGVFFCASLLLAAFPAYSASFYGSYGFLWSASPLPEIHSGTGLWSPRTDEYDTHYVEARVKVYLGSQSTLLDIDDNTCVREGSNDLSCATYVHWAGSVTANCQYCAERYAEGKINGVVFDTWEGNECEYAPGEGEEEP